MKLFIPECSRNSLPVQGVPSCYPSTGTGSHGEDEGGGNREESPELFGLDLRQPLSWPSYLHWQGGQESPQHASGKNTLFFFVTHSLTSSICVTPVGPSLLCYGGAWRSPGSPVKCRPSDVPFTWLSPFSCLPIPQLPKLSLCPLEVMVSHNQTSYVLSIFSKYSLQLSV